MKPYQEYLRPNAPARSNRALVTGATTSLRFCVSVAPELSLPSRNGKTSAASLHSDLQELGTTRGAQVYDPHIRPPSVDPKQMFGHLPRFCPFAHLCLSGTLLGSKMEPVACRGVNVTDMAGI